MQKYILIFVTIIISILLFSCSKTDTTKPSFELISPEDADTFQINDTIFFHAVFHDNKALNQFHLEMKNDFAEIADSLPAWKFILIDALQGTEDNVNSELIIPDTIYSGNYLLILKCADVDGNEAATDTARIVIQ